MGKFSSKVAHKMSRKIEKRSVRNQKEALKRKTLLRVIRHKKTREIKDAILLFGKHRDKRITDLLNTFDYAPYVINYLSASEDLPKRFKKIIRKIIEKNDPFLNNESWMPKPSDKKLRVDIKYDPGDIPF